MSILVEQQDEQITAIKDTVQEVEKDVETGSVIDRLWSHFPLRLTVL